MAKNVIRHPVKVKHRFDLLPPRAVLLHYYRTSVGTVDPEKATLDLGISLSTVLRALKDLKGLELPPAQKIDAESLRLIHARHPRALTIQLYLSHPRKPMRRSFREIGYAIGASRATAVRAVRVLRKFQCVDRFNDHYKANTYEVRMPPKRNRVVRTDVRTNVTDEPQYDRNVSTSVRTNVTGEPVESTSYLSKCTKGACTNKRTNKRSRRAGASERTRSEFPLKLSPKKVRVSPTHKELLSSSDLLDSIDSVSPGTYRLNDLRRPHDPLLYTRIATHPFLNQLLDDSAFTEQYRQKYWRRIFYLKKGETENYELGEPICFVPDTEGRPDILVTQAKENLARKLHSTFNQMLQRKKGMFYKSRSRFSPESKTYSHFVRAAESLVHFRSPRLFRQYLHAQFAQFDEMKERWSGMPAHAVIQPNFLYGENAERRYADYMHKRMEDARRRSCVDEGMAAGLRVFAEIQHREAKKGEVVTAHSFLTDDSGVIFSSKDLLTRFFGIRN